MNHVLKEEKNNNSQIVNDEGYDFSYWINDLNNIQGPVQVKLLCGADLLQSFGVPGLWAEDDVS